MDWLKSKTAIVGFCCLALIGVETYSMLTIRRSFEERIDSMEGDFQTMREDSKSKMTMLESDLGVIAERMQVTTEELKAAQTATTQLKQQNAQLVSRLRRDISGKANSKDMLKFQEESANQLDVVRKDASSKIDGVSGQVKGVRMDLDATREDLANSKRELSTLIAHNSTELAALRRRGDRDYVEFDIKKGKQYKRVGDVLVQLRKTDVKKHKYEVALNADDKAIIKKDRTVNEPIALLVGRDRIRYEFVVFNVSKDRIRGYVSAPKDYLVASDAPSLHVQ